MKRIFVTAVVAITAATVVAISVSDDDSEPQSAPPAPTVRVQPISLDNHEERVQLAQEVSRQADREDRQWERKQARKEARQQERREARQAERREARQEARAEERAEEQAAQAPVVVAVSTSGNRALGQEMMLARGWGSDQWPCLEQLWSHESGWRTTASNPSSEAYGIPQALPGSKMATAGSDWQTNPATQIKWGLSYIGARYGSPCGAWGFFQANNWY